jgi:hypothetical protein
MATLCIEADGPANENLGFRPIQRAIRGRFDWNRCADPEAHRLSRNFGGVPIPGQRIEFDPDTGTAALIDPLHAAEHAAIAEAIRKQGYRLPPAREQFTGCDRDTWLFWIKGAIEAGLAKLIGGKLPEFDASKARRDFIFAPPQPGTADKLIDALNSMAAAQAAQTAVLEKLLVLLAKK